jgi:hypothetical protein
MECEPAARLEVVNAAFPALSATVASTTVPSLKVTDPVGVPVVEDFTVEVKVTADPCFDGLREEVTVEDVAALLVTKWSTGDVLPVKFALPG